MNNNTYLKMVLFPVLFVLLATIIITTYNISNLKKYEVKIASDLKQDFIDRQKDFAKNRVQNIIDTINLDKSNLQSNLKKEIQNKIDYAYKVTQNLYRKYENRLSDDLIKDIVKTSISNIPFNNNGYFYIIDLNTNRVILHKLKHIVGKDMTNFKDVRGVNILNLQKEVLSKTDGAFVNLHFYKPSDPHKEFNKVVYVKKIEQFNWLIGTGAYIEDEILSSKNKILENLVDMHKKIKHEKDNNTFIIRSKTASNMYSTVILNKSHISNYTSTYESFLTKHLERLKKEGSVFLQYKHSNTARNEYETKISYFYYDKDWKWIIGSGFFLNDIQDEIKKIEENINLQIKELITAAVVVCLIFSLITIVLVYLTSGRMAQTVRKHSLTLENLNKQLKIEKDLFSTFYEKSADGIILIANEQFIDCNESMLKFFKYPNKDEFLRKNMILLSAKTQLDGTLCEDGITQQFNTCLKEDTVNFEWLFKDYENRDLWGEITLTKITLEDEIVILASFRDINIKKELEEKTQEQNLFIAQHSKTSALNEMFGNIAHQWRQPLTAISMSSNRIIMGIDLNDITNEEIKKSLGTLNEKVKYLSDTIDNFRNNFKTNDSVVEVVSIELVNKIINMVSTQFKSKDIKIIQNIKEIQMVTFENELIQVLIDILNNSRDQLIKKENQERLIFLDLDDKDDRVIINVQDNAGGIGEDIINKIFEPYFTTKHQSSGTGIGLYMVNEIISMHLRGDISAKNVEFEFDGITHKGALFTISIVKNLK